MAWTALWDMQMLAEKSMIQISGVLLKTYICLCKICWLLLLWCFQNLPFLSVPAPNQWWNGQGTGLQSYWLCSFTRLLYSECKLLFLQYNLDHEILLIFFLFLSWQSFSWVLSLKVFLNGKSQALSRRHILIAMQSKCSADFTSK